MHLGCVLFDCRVILESFDKFLLEFVMQSHCFVSPSCCFKLIALTIAFTICHATFQTYLQTKLCPYMPWQIWDSEWWLNGGCSLQTANDNGSDAFLTNSLVTLDLLDGEEMQIRFHSRMVYLSVHFMLIKFRSFTKIFEYLFTRELYVLREFIITENVEIVVKILGFCFPFYLNVSAPSLCHWGCNHLFSCLQG